MIKEKNKAISISELNKEDINTLKKWQKEEYKDIRLNLKLVLDGQKLNQKELRLGFIGLATQNSELLSLNKELNQNLKKVKQELDAIKREREEKAARREKWSKRKRLPKRDPITPEIYRLLIQATESPTYTAVRLRIAFCLLTITGIRINELLPLKVNQLQTLLESHWIAIDRSKRGPSNHKAFLNREGKKLVKERKKDFEFLFLLKDKDSYIFTTESNHYKMLSREALTKDVNKIMRSVSATLPDQPNLTSHSFRIGYISQLWKDTKDIEFVKQSIGHRSMNATSTYVRNLSDLERQQRINS